jgi:hypothetical protein
MKNAVYCHINTQFVPHKRHITSPLRSPNGWCYVRFEVFTAVTMKIAVFWDIKTQFVPHRRHITSPLRSPIGWCYVRFEVFTAVTMKNAVFWDIKTQFIPHRRHQFSAIEPSRLMLCKIWGFHSGHYEEWRLLRYKYPVRTSQRQITSPLQSPTGYCYGWFEIFTAVTMKNAVFWMLHRVVLVRTNVSGERNAFIVRM